MSVTGSSAVIVPDPGNELVSMSGLPLPDRQHRAAEIRQQAEILMQPGGVKQRSVLHCFYILPYRVRDFLDSHEGICQIVGTDLPVENAPPLL